MKNEMLYGQSIYILPMAKIEISLRKRREQCSSAVHLRLFDSLTTNKKDRLMAVEVRGIDVHLLPMGANKGSNQCLHWLQQQSTGLLHLRLFDSLTTNKKDRLWRWR